MGVGATVGFGNLVWVREAHGGKAAANERITLGLIGMGTRVQNQLLRGFLEHPDTQVVSVCDVWDHRVADSVRQAEEFYGQAKRSGDFHGVAGVKDFREIVSRADIDAVVIGTPDHWHAVQALMAIRAGKDVYCEKPLTRTVEEARVLVAAVREHETIFQTGSQQRSDESFRFAAELVRSGRIGTLQDVSVQVGGPPDRSLLPGQAIPASLDWEMWLGPAAWRPYHEELCPQKDGTFPNWRGYEEFGGGGVADMGAHHFDIAQWAMDMDRSGPIEVVPPEDGSHSGLYLRYASGVCVHHLPDCIPGTGLRFDGTEGSITAVRWKCETDPVEIGRRPIGPEEVTLYKSDDHMGNWLECIRSRKDPVAPVEAGAHTAVVCHLVNIGYKLGRALKWDPSEWAFVGDAEANGLLKRTLRSPWTL